MPTYSDSEMRAIMGRALQIDSGRSERFTPEQLRTIAAELGISTQALEVAMYEADTNGRALAVHPTPASNASSWARRAAIAVGVIIVVGFGLAFLRNDGRDVARASRAQAVRVEEVPVVEVRRPPVAKKITPSGVPTKVTTKTRF